MEIPMAPNLQTLAALAVVAATSSAAVAADTSIPGNSFYQDKERGWFWYEEPVEEATEEKPEPEQAAVPVEQPEAEETTQPEELEPRVGSVAWIRANLPMLRDKAIEDPTDENIQAYYYAQRLMLDMSERFARRTNEVISSDPFLDEDLRSPASNAAAEAIAKDAVAKRDMLLERVAGKAALIFFYEGNNCRMCGPTISSLESLAHRYKFTVMAVSMDGAALPGNPFGPTQYDSGLAEHLGVLTTPAIAIALPPNSTEIVSYSAVSMEAASMRILNASKRLNIITENELHATERINNIGLIDNQALSNQSSDIANDANSFVQLMRAEAKNAFTASGE
ncbi:MAG: conjugal transfer protein TraF [Halopseudomonas aestusnigri]|nr:conjugal transfer protein TraF [Halopseudomonas aestusnigri]